jgi:hypothetical protein
MNILVEFYLNDKKELHSYNILGGEITLEQIDFVLKKIHEKNNFPKFNMYHGIFLIREDNSLLLSSRGKDSEFGHWEKIPNIKTSLYDLAHE